MAKKVARLGLFLCAAMLISYIETLLPLPLGVPGLKIGLANTAVLFLLYTDRFSTALGVNVLRILLTHILFGNVMGLAYALTGGILSSCVMFLAKKIPALGPVGISVLGAVCHNLGQTAAAALLLSPAVFYYLLFLVPAGVVSGIGIGILAWLLLKRTPTLLKAQKS